jgi:hypothetical protein
MAGELSKTVYDTRDKAAMGGFFSPRTPIVGCPFSGVSVEQRLYFTLAGFSRYDLNDRDFAWPIAR